MNTKIFTGHEADVAATETDTPWTMRDHLESILHEANEMMQPGYGQDSAKLFGLPYVPMDDVDIMRHIANRIGKALTILGCVKPLT